jgi:hypothetical protein
MDTLELKQGPGRLLVTLLMLSVCAIGQAAPRPGLKPASHPGIRLFNTTLPVPETTTASIAGASIAGPADANAPERVAASHAARGEFPIHWRESREIAGPELVSRIRNYKRDGFPIVQLWQSTSDQSRVAIGVNPHGLPGIYFTHHVGG